MKTRVAVVFLMFAAVAFTQTAPSSKLITLMKISHGVYVFRRGTDLYIEARCTNVEGKCTLAGFPGDSTKEDDNQKCVGYSNKEIRYALNTAGDVILFTRFNVPSCGYDSQDEFTITQLEQGEKCHGDHDPHFWCK